MQSIIIIIIITQTLLTANTQYLFQLGVQQFASDTNAPELAQTPQAKGSV